MEVLLIVGFIIIVLTLIGIGKNTHKMANPDLKAMTPAQNIACVIVILLIVAGALYFVMPMIKERNEQEQQLHQQREENRRKLEEDDRKFMEAADKILGHGR